MYGLGQLAHHFLDADGAVIVDARLLGFLQVGIIATFQPLAGNALVAETHGTDGTGHVTLATGAATRRIFTQQATGCLFLEIHLVSLQIIYILVISF